MAFRKISAVLVLGGLVAGTHPAAATTVFTDSTFNPINYTSSASYASIPGSTITFHQCATCGDPGTALEFNSTIADIGTTNGVVDLGVYNDTFFYNPTIQGAITSITASVDKNLGVTEVGSGIGNTFRPLIEQDGNFYLAAIPGPTFTGPNIPGGTGYHVLSSNLTASDFTSFDFATDTFGTAHPDFSGDGFFLGIGQITTLAPGSVAFADYDNLSFTLSTVPLPASAPMFSAALVALGAVGYGLKRKAKVVA